MGILRRLRLWWQTHSGDEDTPFDGAASAWIASLVVHLLVLVLLTAVRLTAPPSSDDAASLVSTALEELPLETPEWFESTDDPQEAIGDLGFTQVAASGPAAPLQADITADLAPDVISSVGQVELADLRRLPQTALVDVHMAVHGTAGAGTRGAAGAVDRIAHEILLSVEHEPTLVVWIFDQSLSLQAQRKTIRDRFERIYGELGLIEASGNPAFAQHKDKPLLTAVMAFGSKFEHLTPKPTDDLAEILAAVASIKNDPLGEEHVFTAVTQAVKKYRPYRVQAPRRNVMIVVFTDERGNDIDRLDATVNVCQRLAVPVYVVGVPAPFGRKEALVKYVDPDPSFDQTPRLLPVDQGPESLYPERIKLYVPGAGRRDAPIDSGFGPYGLTRLCVATGGIYFAVHPKRNEGRWVGLGDTPELSAYVSRFVDSTVMTPYRPNYVSVKEYQKLLRQNKARSALVQAARVSWVGEMQKVQLRFPKQSEAELANLLSQAQRAAAKREPKIRQIYSILAGGAKDRDKLEELRWQAGFDLAMGRTLAIKVRTESYNGMLAIAKQGLRFQDPKNNTWVLVPSNEVTANSVLEKQGQDAIRYLDRVVEQHPNTPWAMLAAQERKQPLSWKWTEAYTPIRTADRRTPNVNRSAMPRDDQLRMLPKPKPKRKPPAL